MRKCTKCKKEQPLTEFHNHRGQKGGLSLWCKSCVSKQGKKYRSTAAGVYSALKSLNKFRNRKNVFITRAEFIEWYDSQPRVCVYCGIEEENLQKLNDPFNNMTKQLTVDCITNDVEYAKGNLVLACRRCNTIKMDLFTYDEMLDIGQRHVKPKWEHRLLPTSANLEVS